MFQVFFFCVISLSSFKSNKHYSPPHRKYTLPLAGIEVAEIAPEYALAEKEFDHQQAGYTFVVSVYVREREKDVFVVVKGVVYLPTKICVCVLFLFIYVYFFPTYIYTSTSYTYYITC
jgi:hypothetical protein